MRSSNHAKDEFKLLVDQHYEGLYRFGYSLAKSPDAAADLVQETFCIWAQKGHQLKDRSRAKSWLYTSLYREFLSRQKRGARFTSENYEGHVARQESGSEIDAERLDDADRLMRCLGRLDEHYRSVISLFYLREHSYQEIAEILELPIGTVMSRLARAKRQLRKMVEDTPSAAPRNVVRIEQAQRERGANHG